MCRLLPESVFSLSMHSGALILAAFQIPDNLSFDQASTIPLGLATAAVGLYQKKKERGGVELVAPWTESGRGKYAGQAIFIQGGASSVGQYGTLLLSACQV
jgi:NADPH:quinone reductase-like Zn-dependent oxidoreductase